MTSTAPTNFDADIEEAVAEGRISFRSALQEQHERDDNRMHVYCIEGCTWLTPDRSIRGMVVGFTTNRRVIIDGVIQNVIDGAFIRVDGTTTILYVELGELSGDRSDYREILGWRVIDRDEFDRLTGIADARTAMGWPADA